MTRRRGPPADSAMLSDAERASRLRRRADARGRRDPPGNHLAQRQGARRARPSRHRGRSAPRRPSRHRRRPALRRAAPRSGGRDRARARRPRLPGEPGAQLRRARDPSLEGVRRARTLRDLQARRAARRLDAIERAAAPDVLADADVAPRAPPSDAAAAAAVAGPPQPPTASPSPTHRTTLLRPPPPAVVPSLANLALATRWRRTRTPSPTCHRSMKSARGAAARARARGKLTTPIARVFIGSGHQELAEAVSQLNLFAGIRPGTGFAPRTRPFPGYDGTRRRDGCRLVDVAVSGEKGLAARAQEPCEDADPRTRGPATLVSRTARTWIRLSRALEDRLFAEDPHAMTSSPNSSLSSAPPPSSSKSFIIS